ncbi:MAG: prephenate dehydratase [Leptolyngbyaceae bacterium]|nr:prephenate dehydratase [Leptolyngbyaceae bacterium]
MTPVLSFLGPVGTYSDVASLACAQQWQQENGTHLDRCPYPSIPQVLKSVEEGEAHFAIVPVENSTEGSVTVTLDTLWQLDMLQIQQAWTLPISHALISRAASVDEIHAIYSHPQALAQCQEWLASNLPNAKLVPTRSTTEALQYLDQPSIAAIASRHAAEIYQIPVVAHPINDQKDNRTRFWVLGMEQSRVGTHTSLALSLPANVPGALLKPLEIFASRGLNLSRIESRPTKRSLGEYIFFLDVEADLSNPLMSSALDEIRPHTETLKTFGSYSILHVENLLDV